METIRLRLVTWRQRQWGEVPAGMDEDGPMAVAGASAPRGADPAVLTPLDLEHFLYGLVMVDRGGEVLYVNRKARQILLLGLGAEARGGRCCDLICNRLAPIVGEQCIAEHVAHTATDLGEVRIDIEDGRLPGAAWVSASGWGPGEDRIIFHLRPASPRDRRRRIEPGWSGPARSGECKLRIATLGRFAVEGADGPINGDWLEHRPGQLLKFLVCNRRRAMTSDQIAEAIWPEADPRTARNRLRFYVHALRERLEPERACKGAPRFILARRGSYSLDIARIWLDVEEFEREALAGLAAFEQGIRDCAREHLRRAVGLYKGAFIAEDPYAQWALEEREQTQDLACRILRAQIEIAADEELCEVAAFGRVVADLEPLDTEVQKLLIGLCIRRGRRSEAIRRYGALRKRTQDYFGEEPDFDLQGLAAESAAPSPIAVSG